MARAMILAGVIRNPHSARNARAMAGPWRPLARELGLSLAQPETRSGLRHALGIFRQCGIELVAIDGGDGTVREVLTTLAAMEWWPRLAVLPAGKINLIAGDVGFPTGGEDGLRALAALARRGWDSERSEHRKLLRLDRAGHGPVFGMFGGAGAFTQACALTNAHLHPRGIEDRGAVAAGLVLSLGRAALGKMTKGDPMTVSVDGATPVNGNHFLILATTLNRLMLGLWPFWHPGDGGIHLLDIQGPPRHLGRALMPLLRGRPRKWMPASGYHSTDATAVDIATAAPMVLDGEEFLPGPDGRLRLSAGPSVEFVRP